MTGHHQHGFDLALAIKSTPVWAYLAGFLVGFDWGLAASMLAVLYTTMLITEKLWKWWKIWRSDDDEPV